MKNEIEFDSSNNNTSFKTGDILEQYRHYGNGSYIMGQESDMVDTLWKVIQITPDFIEMTLVEGQYKWGIGGVPYKNPGYTSEFRNSTNYCTFYPDKPLTAQIYEEYQIASATKLELKYEGK
jgi:hypothetical protein